MEKVNLRKLAQVYKDYDFYGFMDAFDTFSDGMKALAAEEPDQVIEELSEMIQTISEGMLLKEETINVLMNVVEKLQKLSRMEVNYEK